ncbi:hypothetical protein [Pseudomonas putida]|uniref:hypothetical protein n=1 Tax=Pseudomonas putida TaxID=303 RepID=UPI0018D867A5|nr:hypothetical protein [Pseudomonas putida]MBH3413966.1 hypothetical protein [Pseudomonas putida]
MPHYKGGEIVIDEDTSSPRIITRTSSTATLDPSTQPKIPDYLRETIKVERKTMQLPNQLLKEISGTIELTADIGRHNILAASLYVAYWPDRTIPSAFAETLQQVHNQ